MAGTGRVSVSKVTPIGYNQYDVTVKFDIAFDYGGWNSNGAYYDIWCAGKYQTGTATFSINSGNGSWVWVNIGSKTFRVTMPKSGSSYAVSISGYIQTGVSPATIEAKGTYTLPARTWQWRVAYNANGGTGAPSSQTKNYGSDLKLSTMKPTRTGYIFKGWATSSTGSVAYQPGGTYKSNASVTLYAIWEIITYQVSYDANGGAGAPSAQTKKHGTALTLSSTTPTKTNYNFNGWGTSAEATTVAYQPGGSYTKESNITLYAIWTLAYIAPRITNLSVDRCYANGTLADDGSYARVIFNWETDKPASNIDITCDGKTSNITISGTTGSVDRVIGDGLLNTEIYYNISIKVADTHGSTSVSRTVEPMTFIIDVKKGGDGIAFGKPASRVGFDVHMDAFFDKPVSFDNSVEVNDGKLILNHAAILSNTDLNTIKTPGTYACYNAEAATLINCPTTLGFYMEVGYAYSGTNYLYQRLTVGASGITHYRRGKVGMNTWTEWKKYITEDMLGDYIVDIGISGRWLYKKYNSGYVEVYGNVAGTPHNGVFLSIEFPAFMLYEYKWTPRIIPGSSYTTALGMARITSQSHNYNGHYAAHYYVRNEKGEIKDVLTSFDVFAIGRWKPF